MTVRVATCSAEQLFSGSLGTGKGQTNESIVDSAGAPIAGNLTIPEYQRPYCWTDVQLQALLLDVELHAEHHPELPYYLGSLILHQDNGKLNIIDGQQRITSLALMACLLHAGNGATAPLAAELLYEHPVSQQQIKHNLKWLQQRFLQQPEKYQKLVDFTKLRFTLVITRSEDDAYCFFETQNTGGVRLGGPDIIKAHHLRAVERVHQPQFAKQWEALGSLDDTVRALLKGRYWQGVNPRHLPSHQQKKQVRDSIVSELALKTGTGADVAYGRVRRYIGLAGEISQQTDQQGYEVRQPLNVGINTIRYLSYFQSLHKRYWQRPNLPHLEYYQAFVEWLKSLGGCSYLQGLYESCLLLYISQFGENQLEQAAKKLFRVVYSRRVSNQKSVRENSIPAFVREHPVLDWIALSYTPEQCFTFLDDFELKVDPSNLDKNSVKKRYVDSVNKQFGLGLTQAQYEKEFATALTRKVRGPWP